MGLAGDLKEVRTLWKKTSFSGKAFLVLSGFLATSSFASLSDHVFQWKGFILDGIIFYREYVSGPAMKAAIFVVETIPLDLSLKESTEDLLIIYCLQMMAFNRYQIGIFGWREVLKSINTYSSSFLLILTPIGIGLDYGPSSGYGPLSWGIIVFSIIVLFALPLSEHLFGKSNRHFDRVMGPYYKIMSKETAWILYEKRLKKATFNYYVSLVFSVVAVLVLAAINAGLTRPLP